MYQQKKKVGRKHHNSSKFYHIVLQLKTQNVNKIKDKKTRAYTKAARGECEENGNVECLHEKANAIDGQNEYTIGMYKWHPINNPHHAIQQRC